MTIILLGASGMVGLGALREALDDENVQAVLSVGRRPSGVVHPKLRELVVHNLFDTVPIEQELVGWDACIWAVGISSVGLDEAAYARVTEELTLHWARLLLRLNPKFSFCYCSAAGAGGKSMWARVRQRVESDLKLMSFQHAGVVRPAFIRPGPGIRSRTRAYQIGMTIMKPIFPLLVSLFPSFVTSSEKLGRAMLRVVQGRADRFILESRDINRVGR